MTSTSLPWHWVIETLADLQQIDTSILRALIFKDPEFLTGIPGPVRERVALRYLEELVGVDRAEGPSEWASTGQIGVDRSCEEVLCREARKFCQVARLFNLEKDRVNLLTNDLCKFILQKRASLSKSSLDKGHCPALLPLKVISGLPIQNEVDYSHQSNVGVESQMLKKLKVSIHDTEFQSLRSISAALAPGNCIAPLQEECPISIKQLLKHNVADFDRVLQRDDVNTGGKCQTSNDFIENERLKKIKLGTGDYHFQSVEQNLGVLAPGISTAISREDPSESMQHLLKENSADADIVITGANGEAIRQSSMCELPDINAGSVQIPQPQQISARPVPDDGNIIIQADSPGLGRHVPQDVFVTGDDHAHLMKDASITWRPCNEDGSLQHTPIDGSGENMNPVFYEKSHLNVQLNVTPEIARDCDSSSDVPSDIELNNDVIVAEKHRLMSSQVNINDDSAIGDCAERGLCIKCKKDGELLTCSGSGCLISIHETCLGSSPKFEMSELFYCPFCSYMRAATAYRKAKKHLFRARKVLSEFIGGDFVQGHRKNLSPSSVLKETNQTRVVGNSCSELNVDLNRYKGDKPNETSIEANEQTQQVEVAHTCDNCKLLCRKAQNLGSERSFNISHNTAELNYDKIVHEVTSPIQNANADLSKGDIVSCNNCEQDEVADNQKLGEPPAAAENVHLTCLGDPCHAKYVHDVGQGDIGMINDRLDIQRSEAREEEEDHGTVDELSTGEKRGKRRQQDAPVADNNCRNKSSAGESGRRDFRAKRYSNPILPSGRRTRLPWTTEEEEVLKEAVHKLSEKNDGNMPWVKILEYGRRVFHKTRQPGDLKDKWRNMKKKEA